MNILITEEQIRERILSLSQEINQYYKENLKKNERLLVVGILKGCFMFLSDIVKHLDIPVRIEFIKAKSYVGQNSGPLKFESGLSYNYVRKDPVLLVDDILDTGQTLYSIVRHICSCFPSDIQLCVLLNKEKQRQNKPVIFLDKYIKIEPKFIGFNIPNVFVYGYGLDNNEFDRNKSNIYLC